MFGKDLELSRLLMNVALRSNERRSTASINMTPPKVASQF
jgi:hypothetical protein